MTEIKYQMINNALRLLRLYLGLSQKQLAAELGISQSMISEIEGGVKQASLEVLQRYSSKLDVRMSQLLFFAEELDGEPLKTKGRLIIAGRALKLLEKMAPREIVDAT